MTTLHIFTYGTLMYPDIWGNVVANHYDFESATVAGYQRLRVQDELYPALVAAEPSDLVSGVLYRNVSPADVALLDVFEGSEYDRVALPVQCATGETVQAQLYLWQERYLDLLSDEVWLPERFGEQAKAAFRKHYLGFSDSE